MADQQASSMSCGWENMPSEVVGRILEHLDPTDLKSCRSVNKQTSTEAARHLFSTLTLGPNVDSYERASEIMVDPDCAKYIRSVEYKGYNLAAGRTRYLRRMMAKLQSRNVTTISLSGLDLNEAICLFFDEKERAGLLARATHLTLDFKSFVSMTNFTELWDQGLSQGCHSLSGQLRLLQTLHLEFASLPGYHLPQYQVQKDITKSLLSQKFARLTIVTLRNVVATENNLADFIKRHHKTLRSLTLRGLHLEGARVSTFDKFGRGWASAPEFILSLNSKIRFKGVRLEGSVAA